MRPFLVAALLAALAWSLNAQQPNSPLASAKWNDVNGPAWPIQATVSAISPLTYRVEGQPNRGYLLAWTAAGLSPGSVTTLGGTVDLNLASPATILLDGLFGTQSSIYDAFANTGPQGQSLWSFPAPPIAAGDYGGLQTVVGDPTSPVGFRLTAATHLVIVDNRVYVSATTGAAGNPGTQAAPVSTIAAGIAIANAGPLKGRVQVALGTYLEWLVVPDGVSVEGGFNPSTWTRGTGSRSTVQSPTTALVAGVVSPTTIRGLTMQGAVGNGLGASSVALFVDGSTSALTIDDCGFVPGSGFPGSMGFLGPFGPSGAAGTNGQAGASGAPTGGAGGGGGGSLAGSPGGNGGAGGYGLAVGATGAPGSLGPGLPVGAGTFGGAGGVFGGCGGAAATPGQPGTNGASGTNGAAGAGGGGAPAVLGFGVIYPANGQMGVAGTAGTGGGGGGGGGGGIAGSTCAADCGGGGGGGGGGGMGGGAGTGGGGGGSSIGILLFNSSPIIMNCTITTANGGPGGNGGGGAFGGAGGAGGLGGAAADDAAAGGNGGAGGAGGKGGGGGGGGGGWCIGIYRQGGNATLIGNVINLNVPGTGGFGGGAFGGNIGGNGNPGAAMAIY